MPPFPAAYERAQVAMRYLGWLRDAASLDDLVAQLGRKDPGLDITQQGLMGAGMAMRGMALRAVARGAAQGMSEWGPEVGPKAKLALVRLIEDESWHEEARLAACEALAWVAPEDGASLVHAVARFGASGDPRKQFIAGCYATTLAHGGPPEATAAMARALGGSLPAEVRLELGRAIGRAGVTGEVATELEGMLGVPELEVSARLALLLGGREAHVTVALRGLPPDLADARVAAIADAYYLSFSFVSDRDLARGLLGRWVANAGAARALGHGWAEERLGQQLGNLEYDNGPHSLTRAVARIRLLQAARRERGAAKDAIGVLAAMKEVGALMALARDEAPHAATAAEALTELRASQAP
jgi:hypothetical protein